MYDLFLQVVHPYFIIIASTFNIMKTMLRAVLEYSQHRITWPVLLLKIHIAVIVKGEGADSGYWGRGS